MEIKASINFIEGGVEDSVNFTVSDRNNNRLNINFKCTPSPKRIRVLNINNEAYAYMTGKECPEWCKKVDWYSMSKKKRFEAHINRMADDFHSKVMNYEVFND